jgi:hypothetical protein
MATVPERSQRFHLERARFEVPPGFVDLTNYTFKSLDASRQLVIHSTTRLASDAELLAAVAGFRHQVETLLKAGDLTMGPLQVRGDGTSTVSLDYVLPDRLGDLASPLIREFAGFARFADASGAKIALSVPEGTAGASEEFRQVMETIRPASPAAPGSQEAPHRYTRRQAGRLELDVPDSLSPPDCYQFISHDKKVRLYLKLATDGGQATAVRSSIPPGAVREKLTEYGSTEYEMYRTTHEGAAGAVDRYDCSQSMVLDNGVGVELTAQSPPGHDDAMRAAFVALAASVQGPASTLVASDPRPEPPASPQTTSA